MVRKRIPHKFTDGVEHKWCGLCKEWKCVENFGKLTVGWDGLKPNCRSCKAKRSKEYNQRPEVRERTQKRQRRYYKEGRYAERLRKYELKYREKRNLNSRKYKQENPEKCRESQKRCQRRRVLNGKSRAYHNKRYYNDPKYRLIANLRGRLHGAFRAQGVRKTRCTMELCGCSLEKLKQHLESQFTDGMSWDNKGEWHIDHVKPCAAFDLSDVEEQKKCFHYTNLQPLWAIDNIKKGAKY